MTLEKTIIILFLMFGYYRILKDSAVQKVKTKQIQYGQVADTVRLRKTAPYYDHGKFICHIKV